MREYLFRGIILHPTIILNGWFYGDLIHFADGLVAIRQQETGEIQHVISETIGQFTGLLDKNGARIWEGDIVTGIAPYYDYIVEYENVGFYLFHTKLKDYKGDKMRWGLVSRIYELDYELEVIGNIHEK